MSFPQPRLIPHAGFAEAVSATEAMLLNSRPGSLCRLVGLTGIGKSEVAMRAARTIAGPRAAWPEGSLPVVFARATKADRGRFSPKAFAETMFAACMRPDLRWTECHGVAGMPDRIAEQSLLTTQSEFWQNFRSKTNETALRTAFEENCIARRTALVVIEDVHAMCSCTRNVRPSDFVQPWMASFERVGVTALFVGTPAMYELWDGEGEIARRSKAVYMRRYQTTSKSDREDFGAAIKTLSLDYAWGAYEPIQDIETIYLATMGVFGQVLALFDRARVRAAGFGRDTIARADLQASVPNDHELMRMANLAASFDRLARPADIEAARKIYSAATEPSQ